MEKRDKRRRFTILVMAGMVFLLHYLGIATNTLRAYLK